MLRFHGYLTLICTLIEARPGLRFVLHTGVHEPSARQFLRNIFITIATAAVSEIVPTLRGRLTRPARDGGCFTPHNLLI